MTNRILRGCRWAAPLVLVAFVALVGCDQKSSDEQNARNPPSEAQQQAEPSIPPAQVAASPDVAPSSPSVPTERRNAPSAPAEEPRATATTGTTQEPAAPSAQKPTPKDVVVLVGSPMGGVRFDHKKHVALAGNKCGTCHHPSKPQKPLTAPQQACSACHTKVATPPMKTKLQAAFHNPTAQAGTCIGCHKAQNAAGKKKAPVTCADCHKKENKSGPAEAGHYSKRQSPAEAGGYGSETRATTGK